MRVRRFGVSLNSNYAAAQLARAFLHPTSRSTRSPAWLGTDTALAALGLSAADEVGVGRLQLALQAKHVQTRESIRSPSSLSRQAVAGVDPAEMSEPTLPGVVQFAFALPVPTWASYRWHEAEEAHRDQIAAAVMRSAERALAHVVANRPGPRARVADRQPMTGFAAVARLDVAPPRRPVPGWAHDDLEVVGVLLGAQRADGRLVAFNPDAMAPREVRRLAAEAMQQALHEEPALRYAGRQAAAAVRAVEQPGSAPPAHAALRWEHPLERWRALLGDVRAQEVGEHAAGLAHRFRDAAESALVMRRRALTRRVEPRDRVAAREALSLERDALRLAESADAADRDAAALHAERWLLKGRAQAELWRVVKVVEQRAAAARDAREQLLQGDERLGSKRRFDAWVRRNADRLAEIVAVDAELTDRLRARVEQEADLSVEAPPPYVRDAIGEPDPTAPDHRQWTRTASKLVYERHVEAANREVGFELIPRSGRERQALNAEVARLRMRRGIEPLRAAAEIERSPGGPEHAV